MAFKCILLFCLLATTYANPRFGYKLPSRILGGEEAEAHEFPHQVSLQLGDEYNQGHICGGSILSEYWILTAAHCLLQLGDYELYVHAGKHSIKSKEPSEQVSKVDKFFTHEKYSGNISPNDISLLKLKTPVVFNEYVQPIALPKANSEVYGNATLSGWGISNTYEQPDYLQKATLPIVDFETCKEALDKLVGKNSLEPTNICTGPLTGGVGSCTGDAGSPLIKVNGNSKEVVGIVSWGLSPCGVPGAPSIYTKVSSYVDWIQNTIASN